MNQRIQTSLQIEEDGSLICICFNPQEKTWDRQFIYSVKLMKLRGDEFTLQGGRFTKFHRQPQSHCINLPYRRATTSQLIDWINEHNDGAFWSLRGIATDVCSFAMEFSFADGAEAAYFALRWR